MNNGNGKQKIIKRLTDIEKESDLDLGWMKEGFAEYYKGELPGPNSIWTSAVENVIHYVCFEFVLGQLQVCLHVNYKSRNCIFNCYNTETNHESDDEIILDSPIAWKTLVEKIRIRHASALSVVKRHNVEGEK